MDGYSPYKIELYCNTDRDALMERNPNIWEYFDSDVKHKVSLPVNFIQELASSTSVQEVLDTVARWLHEIFDAERASVTLLEDDEHLKVYAMSGDGAIPRGLSLPIRDTFVGRVFMNRQLMICDDLSSSAELDCEILQEAGLNTCMDAPLLSSGQCLGTLNVAHKHPFYYTSQQAVELQCISNWIASNVNLHLQIEKLNYQASVDPLTKALNRRRFMKDVNMTISDFHLRNEACFLGFADFDHFKDVNDKYGHVVGDKFLRQTVSMIKELLGENGHIYRLGGEEFGILLKAKDVDAALCFFESIRKAVEKQEIHFDSLEISSTLCIGVTFLQSGDFSEEQLLKRADEALYEAKSRGRNLVVMLDGEPVDNVKSLNSG